MTKQPPKKSDMLEVRISYEKKRAFLQACRDVGRTASDVVREFIDSYLGRAERRRSSTHEWSIAMTLNSPARRGLALAAGVGALGVLSLVVLSTPGMAQADLQGAFASIDADGDGRVTAAEFADRRAITAGSAELAIRFGGGCEADTSCYVEEWWILGAPSTRRADFAPPAFVGGMWIFGAPSPRGAAGAFDRDERVIRVTRNVADGSVEEDVEFLEDGVELLAEIRQEEFGLADRDSSGAIDLDEFALRYQEIIAEGFSDFDTDGDGRLTAEEYDPGVLGFSRFVAVFGEPGSRSDAGFRRLDRDGDGGLTVEEFSVGS